MHNLLKIIGLRVFAVAIVFVMAVLGYLAYIDKIAWETIVQLEIVILAIGIMVFWFVSVTFQALRTILKFLLVMEYEQALMEKKISYMKLETCERMFSIYSKLGGNSYVEDVMNKIRSLENYGEMI